MFYHRFMQNFGLAYNSWVSPTLTCTTANTKEHYQTVTLEGSIILLLADNKQTLLELFAYFKSVTLSVYLYNMFNLVVICCCYKDKENNFLLQFLHVCKLVTCAISLYIIH